MKKVLVGILAFFSSIMIVNASSIDKVDMDIYIDETGTATITETWDAYVNQGTEGWHPYYNLGSSTIEVIGASMDGEEYDVVSYWNENSSMSNKAYKAGIYLPSSNETDIVFGISSYGNHEYKVTYKITDFVSTVTDADIVYWQLMPYDFSAEPGNVTITISAFYEFADDLDVWGYGKYGAPCYVADGKIHFTSDGILKKEEYLTLLAKFPKGTFLTESVLDQSFDDFLQMANENAENYKYSGNNAGAVNIFLIILVFLVGVCPIFAIFGFLNLSEALSKKSGDTSNSKKVVGIISIIISIVIIIISPLGGFMFFFPFYIILFLSAANKNAIGGKKKKYIFEDGLNKLPNKVENFREIPCNKDIYKAFFISDLYDLNPNRNNFMGVLLLKWIYNNNVKVETIEINRLFKKGKEDVITFLHSPDVNYKYEYNLYSYMLAASNDGKLEKNEFKKWCKKHYSKVLGWADNVIDYERDELINEGLITKEVNTTGTIFKYNNTKYRLNRKIYDDAIELKGLKQFLIEFSEIDKKEPIEVKLWHEYLMYAQIFGIAKKVMDRFKSLYPEIMEDMDNYNFNYTTFTFINSVSSSGISAASSARNSASSYSGGGGGFSSGGGGGGSFGGGGGGGGFR